MVAYDTVLSLGQEVTYIWKRRLNAVTVLYTIVRYGALLAFTLLTLNNLILVGTVSVRRRRKCLVYVF